MNQTDIKKEIDSWKGRDGWVNPNTPVVLLSTVNFLLNRNVEPEVVLTAVRNAFSAGCEENKDGKFQF